MTDKPPRTPNSEDAEDGPPAIGLSGPQQAKLAALAGILGCSQEKAARQLYKRALAAAPNKPSREYLLPDLEIKSCDRIGEEIIRLELSNGRAFFGQRSNQKEYVLHQLLAKHLPDAIDGDAYKLALDVQRRYFGSTLDWYFSNGGVLVEGGCFTGMRAIRWHDLSTKPVRIIAVEIGKTNFDLLTMNIRENSLSDVITPVHAGLADRSGAGVQKHAFSTRRFLETSDQWQKHMRHEEPVSLLTIDDLFDEQGIDVADYVNIQVNGAEVPVLSGINKAFDRIKAIGIAAYYAQDGVRNIDIVRRMLQERNCTTLFETELGRITAATPKFLDEVMLLAPKAARAQIMRKV